MILYENGVVQTTSLKPAMAAPVDVRLVVQLKTDLTSSTTWEHSPVYSGMLTTVVREPVYTDNGLYMLVSKKYYTQFGGLGWIKVGDISTAINNVLMSYKGNVDYYNLLPTTGLTVGDVWNVLYTSTSGTEPYGHNFSWSGTVWDDLGPNDENSNYAILTSWNTFKNYNTFEQPVFFFKTITVNGIQLSRVSGTTARDIKFPDKHGIVALLDDITGTSYTDEQAQDAVGSILTDSGEIDFTYVDETPSISAAIKTGSIAASKLTTAVQTSLGKADSALQSIDEDLTAIAALTGNRGFLTKTAANTWTLDIHSYRYNYMEHYNVTEAAVIAVPNFTRETLLASNFSSTTNYSSTITFNTTTQDCLTYFYIFNNSIYDKTITFDVASGHILKSMFGSTLIVKAGTSVLLMYYLSGLNYLVLAKLKQDILVADTDYLTPTTAANTYEPKKGADDNYVTSAEKTILANTSNTNTGDQEASDFDIKDLTDSTSLRGTWSGKQAALISGTNIKTINSVSLLGSGDMSLVDLASDQYIQGLKWFKNNKFAIRGLNNTYDYFAVANTTENTNYTHTFPAKTGTVAHTDDIPTVNSFDIKDLTDSTNLRTSWNAKLDYLLVTITQVGETYTADKTITQILTAYNAGKHIIALYSLGIDMITTYITTDNTTAIRFLFIYDGRYIALEGEIVESVDTWSLTSISHLQNIVEDTTPQLGGQLDVNGYAVGDGTNELLKFEEVASAVNEITIKNNSTGNSPEIKATGDNTDINLVLRPKGDGKVKIKDAYTLPSADGTAEYSLVTNGEGVLSFDARRSEYMIQSGGTDPTWVTNKPRDCSQKTILSDSATTRTIEIRQTSQGIRVEWLIQNTTANAITITLTAVAGYTLVPLYNTLVVPANSSLGLYYYTYNPYIVVALLNSESSDLSNYLDKTSEQSVSGLKTFDSTKLGLKGSSTGKNIVTSNNTSATDYTNALQAKSGVIAHISDITDFAKYLDIADQSSGNIIFGNRTNPTTGHCDFVEALTTRAIEIQQTSLYWQKRYLTNQTASTITVTLSVTSGLTLESNYTTFDVTAGKVVQLDYVNISNVVYCVVSGIISSGSYTLPTASTTVLGGVKVDETTITIDENGVISSVGGGTGDMLAATYDPTNVAGDAFDMDNMAEGDTNLILTSSERTKIGNALTYFTLTYYQAKPATCATGETCFDNTDGKVYTATGTDTWDSGVAASTSVAYIWQYRQYQYISGTTLKSLSYGKKLEKSPTVTSNAFSWECSGERSKSYVSNNANTTCTVTPATGDTATEHSLLFTNSDASASHTISFAAASGFTLDMVATTLTIPIGGHVELSCELYGTICYIKYTIK